MQKSTTVNFGKKSFTLKELPVRAIWDLINSGSEQGQDTVAGVKALLQKGCPELTEDELLDLYPSEIEELWQAFEEVNSAFLAVVRRAGLIEIVLDGFKPVLKAELQKALSASLTGAFAS